MRGRDGIILRGGGRRIALVAPALAAITLIACEPVEDPGTVDEIDSDLHERWTPPWRRRRRDMTMPPRDLSSWPDMAVPSRPDLAVAAPPDMAVPIRADLAVAAPPDLAMPIRPDLVVVAPPDLAMPIRPDLAVVIPRDMSVVIIPRDMSVAVPPDLSAVVSPDLATRQRCRIDIDRFDNGCVLGP